MEEIKWQHAQQAPSHSLALCLQDAICVLPANSVKMDWLECALPTHMPLQVLMTLETVIACLDITALMEVARNVSLGTTALADQADFHALPTLCLHLALPKMSSASAAVAFTVSIMLCAMFVLRGRGAGLESKTTAQPTPGRLYRLASSSTALARMVTLALMAERAPLAPRAISRLFVVPKRAQRVALGQAPLQLQRPRLLYAPCATAVNSTLTQGSQYALRVTQEPMQIRLEQLFAPHALLAAGLLLDQQRVYHVLRGHFRVLCLHPALGHASHAPQDPGRRLAHMLAESAVLAPIGAGLCASLLQIKDLLRS
jgi:hypothetical protein